MAFAAIHKASGKYGIISAPFLALHQSLTQLTPFGLFWLLNNTCMAATKSSESKLLCLYYFYIRGFSFPN